MELILEGILIDDETGEVMGDMPGFDRAAWAATRLQEYKAQIKSYEQAAAIAEQVLLRYQGTKTADYGNLRASVRQNARNTQDVGAIRDWIHDTELTRADLEALAIAAKGWDVAKLPEPLADLIDEHTAKGMTRAFVVLETVRRPAPKVEKPDTLLADLEASGAAERAKRGIPA